MSCAEPVLYCSCADHGKLRGTRGIFRARVLVFAWLRDGSSAVPLCREGSAAWQARGFSCVAGWCHSQAIRCAQERFRGPVPNGSFLGQSGAYRCSPAPGTPAVPYRAVPRSCAAALGVPRCIGYSLRKRSCRHTATFGSLSLKCLRSHPTPLRFYPQALSGAPVLS